MHIASGKIRRRKGTHKGNKRMSSWKENTIGKGNGTEHEYFHFFTLSLLTRDDWNIGLEVGRKRHRIARDMRRKMDILFFVVFASVFLNKGISDSIQSNPSIHSRTPSPSPSSGSLVLSLLRPV